MTRLPDVTSKWLGTEYTTYGFTPEEGCDCFSFLYKILEDDYGVKLPSEWRGFNLENYYQLYMDDEEKAIDLWTEFFQDYLKEVEEHELINGDILLVKSTIPPIKRFFVIYIGNKKIINVDPKYGVRPMHFRRMKILKVFRGVSK